MKKFLAVLLVFAIGLTMGTAALAADLDQGTIAQRMTGYLYDDAGNCVEVIGRLVETNVMALSNANDSIAATYEFNLKSTTFNSNPVSSPDSGYSSTVYLTVNYYRNGLSYLLSSVSGSWVIEDSRVSVTSASLNYFCVDSQHSLQIGSRAVSNNFYVGTGFSTYVEGSDATVGAQLTLTYLMGNSRSWTFTLPHYVA